MPYSESTAVANIDAFIQAFVNFAVANAGFTNQGTTVNDTKTIYHISKGSIYWNFMEDQFTQTVLQNGIYCRMSFAKVITRTNMKANNPQAGQRMFSRMCYYEQTGPFVKYFLYTDGNAVHCVLQLYTGVYTHLSFGNLIKLGTWTGGEYLSANNSYWYSVGKYDQWDYQRMNLLFDGGNSNLDNIAYGASYVRHVVGTQYDDYRDFARLGHAIVDNNQAVMMNKTWLEDSATGEGIFSFWLIEEASPIGYNVRSPLLPVWTRFKEMATGRWMLRGYVPYAGILNVENLAGETIVENDWIVFPMIQKTGGDETLSPLSEYWGVAYKRVT